MKYILNFLIYFSLTLPISNLSAQDNRSLNLKIQGTGRRTSQLKEMLNIKRVIAKQHAISRARILGEKIINNSTTLFPYTKAKIWAGSPRLSCPNAIPPSIVQRVVRHHSKEIKACYENELQKNPTLKGNLILYFSILKSGKTGHVSTSQTLNKKVSLCLIQSVKHWIFPAFNGADRLNITYPFRFRRKADEP